jgi:hypothetical protein
LGASDEEGVDGGGRGGVGGGRGWKVVNLTSQRERERERERSKRKKKWKKRRRGVVKNLPIKRVTPTLNEWDVHKVGAGAKKGPLVAMWECVGGE